MTEEAVPVVQRLVEGGEEKVWPWEVPQEPLVGVGVPLTVTVTLLVAVPLAPVQVKVNMVVVVSAGVALLPLVPASAD